MLSLDLDDYYFGVGLFLKINFNLDNVFKE